MFVKFVKFAKSLNIQFYFKIFYVFVKFAFLTLCKIFKHSMLFKNCI